MAKSRTTSWPAYERYYHDIGSLEDMRWCEDTIFGSGVAKSIVLTIPGSGAGMCMPLNYARLARIHEFPEAEIRAAIGHLVAYDYARIMRDYESRTGEWLYLMTPGRRAYDAAVQAEEEAKAAAKAAKIALRGGQVSRRAISPEVRDAVRARDGDACVKCHATEDLTLDHIHPWSYGGPDTVENLQVLCRSCNSAKGDKT